jgi:hypothetical protein
MQTMTDSSNSTDKRLARVLHIICERGYSSRFIDGFDHAEAHFQSKYGITVVSCCDWTQDQANTFKHLW